MDQETNYTQRELWSMLREEWQEHQQKVHAEDRMSLDDYAHELVGCKFKGYRVTTDFNHNVQFVK